MNRKENIARAKSSHFDVVIIGGGITGAGIFLKCCRRGLKALLLDRDDFAAGTSSRSAKMIHGGLRYLEYLQVKLVREALEEREFLLDNYPHLVKPLPFLLPIYDSHLTRVKMKVGLSGYDALAGGSQLPKHKSLSSSEIRKKYPMLRERGLKGGFYYYDAITNDARLTNEAIMQGCQCGGLALNYVSASLPGNTGNSVGQLSCEDMATGERFNIDADHYISAAGVWSDEFLHEGAAIGTPGSIMKPSKGVHIVVDGRRFPERDVLLIPCEDKRFIWICPWEDGLVLIGATDTAFEGHLREPGTTEEDIRYLLDNTNSYLRNFRLTEDDILSVFSGLRPLLNDEDESDTVKMSRDYKVWWEKEDLLAIAGGKLTSFLSMADHVLDKLSERSSAVKYEEAIGAEEMSSVELIKSIRGEDEDNAKALPGYPGHDIAKVLFYIRHQHAVRISDVLTRRHSISYGMQEYDEGLVNCIAQVMQGELDWSLAELEEHKALYKKHWEILHSWTK